MEKESCTIKWKPGRGDKGLEQDNLVSRPRDTDVLCGRGRGYFEHPGNRRMLAIISQFKSEYQTASKTEKSIITHRVLQLILNPRDGTARPRFLKEESNGKKKERGVNGSWSELCEKEIHKKVAHTLREQKTILKMARITNSDCMGQLDVCTYTPITSVNESCEGDDYCCLGERSQVSIPHKSLATDLARFVSSETYDNGALPMKVVDLQDELLLDTVRSKVRRNQRLMTPDQSCDASTFDANPISDDEEATARRYTKDEGAGPWLQAEPAYPGVGIITPPNEPDEPLSLEQEPIFDENDLHNLLNTVLDDVHSEDEESLLESYLDCLAVGS